MYSKMKTMTSGAIKPANFGTNLSLAFKPLNLTSNDGNPLFTPQSFASMVAMSTFLTTFFSTGFCGERNKNQNVIAWMAGTISIRRSTARGDTPRAMRPAQLNEPIWNEISKIGSFVLCVRLHSEWLKFYNEKAYQLCQPNQFPMTMPLSLS